MRQHLGNIADIERITARVSTGRASPRDLISLGHYLRQGELGWRVLAQALSPVRKDEAVASLRDPGATLYYPLYGFRQWRAHSRGEDTGP